MRRGLLGVMAAALAGCQGLYLDKGNAYPCDFSLGPGARDEACFPGDVCGVDNLCRKYIYEGPRFEGTPQLPVYGPGTSAGALVHPVVMTSAVANVAADLPLGRTGFIYAADDAGVRVLREGQILTADLQLPSLVGTGLGVIERVQPYYPEPLFVFDGGLRLGDVRPDVLWRDVSGQMAAAKLGEVRANRVLASNGQPLSGARLRVIAEPQPVRPADAGTRFPAADAIAWTPTELGVIRPRTGGLAYQLEPWLTGTSEVLDVAGIALRGRGARWLLLLEPETVSVFSEADGGVEPAAALDPLFSVRGGSLRTDPDGRIVAATRTTTLPGPMSLELEVLSTFQVNVSSDGPTLSSPWVDCAPCASGQRIALLSPSVRSGAPTVELVCLGESATAVRVIGSVALTQLDTCLTEPVELPVAMSRVASTAGGQPVSWDAQFGLLIGGKAGELWSGETLSTLRPQFLDRVPLDVAPATVDDTPSLAAITDDSLFLLQPNAGRAPGSRRNGFRRITPRELGVSESARLLGFVHDVAGWAIADTGELVKIEENDGGIAVAAGATLLTASGDLIRDSIGGEAYTDENGAPIAFFVAADDSLYFVPDPESDLAATEQFAVTPDLTPEPSVPIRSLALERTPLGTDGERYARGYLVTSRNVFEWSLGGEPSHWSATPVQLSSGQPVEVWFDTRLSALARVGYADGEVYTLPSGFLLTYPIPENEEGEAGTVLDYENLGGWPVAYTTTGLYIAQWKIVDGKLQNRFPGGARNMPMTWQRVTMPDGSEPWMKKDSSGRAEAARAKLFVVKDPKDANSLTPYRLLVFLDDKVLQVATNLRK